jgi:hypothetical protein
MKVQIALNLRQLSSSSYVIECEGEELLRFEESGRTARVGALGFEQFSWRDVLRWGAPFALAPQGHVALHGSAVRRSEGAVVSFLGVGGAGKSTLAREMARRGWEPVADDMIVCDRACRIHRGGEAILQRWCEAYAGRIDSDTWIDYGDLARRLSVCPPEEAVPLTAVLFLDEERSAGTSFVHRPLPVTDFFCRLVRYGFGGLPCPEAWQYQFQVYATLAARVAGAVLQVPGGLGRMRARLAQLEDHLDRWLNERPGDLVGCASGQF